MPLRNNRMCIQLSAISWFNRFLASMIMQFLIGQLHFCWLNEIDHYFCDNDPLYKLSFSDTSLVELMTFIMTFLLTMPPFFITVASYAYIITNIFRIPSSSGRKKAFSTCSSHLIVVSSFYGSIMIVYMLPKTKDMKELNKIVSVLYTVLPPLINPLIYSLRNEEVKKNLRLLSRKMFGFHFRVIIPKMLFLGLRDQHGEKLWGSRRRTGWNWTKIKPNNIFTRHCQKYLIMFWKLLEYISERFYFNNTCWDVFGTDLIKTLQFSEDFNNFRDMLTIFSLDSTNFHETENGESTFF